MMLRKSQRMLFTLIALLALRFGEKQKKRGSGNVVVILTATVSLCYQKIHSFVQQIQY